jgi:hypothetical protein
MGDEDWQDFFISTALEPIEVAYEDLAQSPETVAAGILEHLGLQASAAFHCASGSTTVRSMPSRRRSPTCTHNRHTRAWRLRAPVPCHEGGPDRATSRCPEDRGAHVLSRVARGTCQRCT